jgi:hypothetical protein
MKGGGGNLSQVMMSFLRQSDIFVNKIQGVEGNLGSDLRHTEKISITVIGSD